MDYITFIFVCLCFLSFKFCTEKKKDKEIESEETVPDDPADEMIVHKKVRSVLSAFRVLIEEIIQRFYA